MSVSTPQISEGVVGIGVDVLVLVGLGDDVDDASITGVSGILVGVDVGRWVGVSVTTSAITAISSVFVGTVDAAFLLNLLKMNPAEMSKVINTRATTIPNTTMGTQRFFRSTSWS